METTKIRLIIHWLQFVVLILSSKNVLSNVTYSNEERERGEGRCVCYGCCLLSVWLVGWLVGWQYQKENVKMPRSIDQC